MIPHEACVIISYPQIPTPKYCQPLDLRKNERRENQNSNAQNQPSFPIIKKETIKLLSPLVKVVTVILSKDYRLDIFEAPALHNPFVVSAIFRFCASICASVCPCPELRSMPRI